jgi:hypothetical protein
MLVEVRDVEALRAVGEPLERAKLAGDLQDRLTTLGKEVSRIRREAVEELLQGGMSQTQVAAALGMSRGRVSQLVASGPPPERAFFGDDKITMSIGGKLEKKDVNPGAVLTTEDFGTFQRFKELAASLQLDAEAEIVPPPGFFRLNRSNLVVVCGPRLSPMIAQLLESDPILGFEEDPEGWYLRDRETGTEYRSPQDSGKPGDVAYFGRLPRPDGKGSFVYMAGIHAQGPAGVVHYLSSKLGEVYRETRLRRFSTLIEHEYNPDTLEPVSSRRLTPLYVHDGR